MNEKDYLSIIKQDSDNALLDKHWLNCAKKKEWVTHDGLHEAFKDMEIGHLATVINMLVRFTKIRYSVATNTLIAAMAKELQSRVIVAEV